MKDPTIAMDSEAEFQLQPPSSMEALELLLGAGLEILHAISSGARQPPASSEQPIQAYGAVIVTWPDEESGEDPSARPIISVSESTPKTLKSALK